MHVPMIIDHWPWYMCVCAHSWYTRLWSCTLMHACNWVSWERQKKVVVGGGRPLVQRMMHVTANTFFRQKSLSQKLAGCAKISHSIILHFWNSFRQLLPPPPCHFSPSATHDCVKRGWGCSITNWAGTVQRRNGFANITLFPLCTKTLHKDFAHTGSSNCKNHLLCIWAAALLKPDSTFCLQKQFFVFVNSFFPFLNLVHIPSIVSDVNGSGDCVTGCFSRYLLFISPPEGKIQPKGRHIFCQLFCISDTLHIIWDLSKNCKIDL